MVTDPSQVALIETLQSLKATLDRLPSNLAEAFLGIQEFSGLDLPSLVANTVPSVRTQSPALPSLVQELPKLETVLRPIDFPTVPKESAPNVARPLEPRPLTEPRIVVPNVQIPPLDVPKVTNQVNVPPTSVNVPEPRQAPSRPFREGFEKIVNQVVTNQAPTKTQYKIIDPGRPEILPASSPVVNVSVPKNQVPTKVQAPREGNTLPALFNPGMSPETGPNNRLPVNTKAQGPLLALPKIDFPINFLELDKQGQTLAALFVALANSLRQVKLKNLAGFSQEIQPFLKQVQKSLDAQPITGKSKADLPQVVKKHELGHEAEAFPVAKLANVFDHQRNAFGAIVDHVQTVYARFVNQGQNPGSGGTGGKGPTQPLALPGANGPGSWRTMFEGVVGRFQMVLEAGMDMFRTAQRFRVEALAANAGNMRFAPFSGELLTEQVRFNVAQIFRTRDISKATANTAVTLTRQVNQMENAFLPFDKATADFSNRVGIFKSVAAKAFADVVLTPLSNAYTNIVNTIDPSGFGTAQASNYLARIGIWGAGGAAAGFVFGGVPGALIGGAVGGVAGAIDAWRNPPDNKPIGADEWTQFLRNTGNAPFLRPQEIKGAVHALRPPKKFNK